MTSRHLKEKKSDLTLHIQEIEKESDLTPHIQQRKLPYNLSFTGGKEVEKGESKEDYYHIDVTNVAEEQSSRREDDENSRIDLFTIFYKIIETPSDLECMAYELIL